MPRGRPKKALKDRAIRLWYVLCVESGADTKVQKEVKRQAKIQGLEKDVGRVVRPRCPQEDDNGVVKRRMMFPGYLLIKCKFNERVFHLVNSIDGAIGFLMDPRNPTPLETVEAAYVLIRQKEKVVKDSEDTTPQPTPAPVQQKYKGGDKVKIVNSAWAGYDGQVIGYKNEKYLVQVMVMGIPTPVPLAQDDIERG